MDKIIFTDKKSDRIRILHVGDIVIHFKHEFDDLDNIKKYQYRIIGKALHTETEEWLMIYQSCLTNDIFARPFDMFFSEVDHKKYPNIKQKYRLELFKEK